MGAIYLTMRTQDESPHRGISPITVIAKLMQSSAFLSLDGRDRERKAARSRIVMQGRRKKKRFYRSYHRAVSSIAAIEKRSFARSRELEPRAQDSLTIHRNRVIALQFCKSLSDSFPAGILYFSISLIVSAIIRARSDRCVIVMHRA